jgi:hypothetical protein
VGLAGCGFGAETVHGFEEFVAGGGVHFVLVFAAKGGKAIEEELGDVGHGEGVAAGDAFAGELFQEVAQEHVDGVGGAEVLDGAKEFGGEGFGVGEGRGSFEAIGMVGAKRRTVLAVGEAVAPVDEHVTAATFGVDMLAVGAGGDFKCCVLFGGHSGPQRDGNKEARRQTPCPLPGSCKIMIPWRLWRRGGLRV